jgi:hypothetical protein
LLSRLRRVSRADLVTIQHPAREERLFARDG